MGWILEHLTDIEHLRMAAAGTSLLVAINYLVLGGMIIPSLAAPMRTTAFGVEFFIGCALTHVMIAMTCMMWPVSAMGAGGTLVMLYAMTFLHVMQLMGGIGFVWDIARSRMILRVEP